MKILCIGDLHGKHEILENALEKFKKEEFNKLIFIGDFMDSFNRSDEDHLKCLKLLKEIQLELMNNFVWLLGNHELSYLFDDQRCSGFRSLLKPIVKPLLDEMKPYLKVAWQIDDYLFTHAGISKKWYIKHLELMVEHSNDRNTGVTTIESTLNNMLETQKGRYALFEVGTKRGGTRYDYGGPLWSDKSEIESFGPMRNFHQIVGHSIVPTITKIDKFNGSHYNNTSVTFIDCLDKEPNNFFELIIEDEKRK